MSNFTDFFAAGGGGGGGLLNIVKYSTARALADSDFRNAASYTVNPATDLGLEDGALLGYFMVGGGSGRTNSGTANQTLGGRILQGTIVVTTAATDLTLTIGVGGSSAEGTESVISGGISLTTASGFRGLSWAASNNYSSGTGIAGYGVGGNRGSAKNGTRGDLYHGWGGGSDYGYTNQGGDGAIILIYP